MIIGGLIYLFYTLTFAIYFHKTADKVFTPTQKRINSVLLWLVPFIWIIILKAIINPTMRAFRKQDSSTNTSDENNWSNSWIFFLHTDSGSYSSHDSGRHYGHSHGHDYHDHGGHHHGSDSTDTSSHWQFRTADRIAHLDRFSVWQSFNSTDYQDNLSRWIAPHFFVANFSVDCHDRKTCG